jgi:hypothetical protein
MTTTGIAETADLRCRYEIFTKKDEKIGNYSYSRSHHTPDSILVESKMSIQTSFLGLRINIKSNDWFVERDSKIEEFYLESYQDIPLQSTAHFRAKGRLEGNFWNITTSDLASKKTNTQKFAANEFSKIKNLTSRIPQPIDPVKGFQSRDYLALDPSTQTVLEVKERLISQYELDFQGQKKQIYKVRNSIDEDFIIVHYFQNGVIYKVETERGYSLLRRSSSNPQFSCFIHSKKMGRHGEIDHPSARMGAIPKHAPLWPGRSKVLNWKSGLRTNRSSGAFSHGDEFY